jgi:hypothetical protein
MPYPGPAKSPTELLQTCLAGPSGDRILASIFTGKVGAVIWATGWKPYGYSIVFSAENGHYVEKKFLD